MEALAEAFIGRRFPARERLSPLAGELSSDFTDLEELGSGNPSSPPFPMGGTLPLFGKEGKGEILYGLSI
jgi:hypothetical protein